MKQKNLHIKIHLGKTNSPKIEKARTFCIMNGTPFVRQYDILNNKWGDFYAKRSTK